jgi:hypothetical protein
MKVFKIIELSQGSDYHAAHHWINADVVALCESNLAAEQHIEELLYADYEDRLANWTEYITNNNSTHPKPKLETNSVWLTEEFNGINPGEHHRFIIEESELIKENNRGA